MTKRKRDIIEPALEVPDDAPWSWEPTISMEEAIAEIVDASRDPKSEPTPEPPDPRYSVHSWNASPLYRCTMCAFDAFEVGRVLEHYDKYHRPVDIIPPLNQLDPEDILARRRARRDRAIKESMGG